MKDGCPLNKTPLRLYNLSPSVCGGIADNYVSIVRRTSTRTVFLDQRRRILTGRNVDYDSEGFRYVSASNLKRRPYQTVSGQFLGVLPGGREEKNKIKRPQFPRLAST